MHVKFPFLSSDPDLLFQGFKFLTDKPITEMVKGAQFLHMLKAEEKNLISISIDLSADSKATLERRLHDSVALDSFGEAARSWNSQGSLVVQEVLEQHLWPLGVKWAREYIRETVEDLLATSCGEVLRDVSPMSGMPSPTFTEYIHSESM
jgi:transcription elongation factor SPT6